MHTIKMSDCPICYDKITTDTGSCTLSCSHSYHLRCIITWITSNETCPCCRKETNTYEKVKDLLANDDTMTYDSYDSTEYLDDIVERWIRTPSGRWIIESTTVPILHLPPHIIRLPYIMNANAEEFIPRSIHLAAVRIQAHIRGYLVRSRLNI